MDTPKRTPLCCKEHHTLLQSTQSTVHCAETSENVQLLIRKAEGGPDALKFTLWGRKLTSSLSNVHDPDEKSTKMLVLFYTRKKNLTEKY